MDKKIVLYHVQHPVNDNAICIEREFEVHMARKNYAPNYNFTHVVLWNNGTENPILYASNCVRMVLYLSRISTLSDTDLGV